RFHSVKYWKAPSSSSRIDHERALSRRTSRSQTRRRTSNENRLPNQSPRRPTTRSVPAFAQRKPRASHQAIALSQPPPRSAGRPSSNEKRTRRWFHFIAAPRGEI